MGFGPFPAPSPSAPGPKRPPAPTAASWTGALRAGDPAPPPPAPYDACDKRPGRVSSLSLVHYRGNDYSVPVAYGHREVLIRGYVDRVVISCASEIITRHRRSYEREDQGGGEDPRPSTRVGD